MIPLIFCHGLASSRTTHSGSCRDLASHGYIVFTVDHHDGTAYYSKTISGTEEYWPLDQELLDIDYRAKQLAKREIEVDELIKDILKEDFLQDTFGFPDGAQMETDKLIIGGHSFGGLTALSVAEKDQRIKAVFTFDPWIWTRNQDVLTNNFKI